MFCVLDVMIAFRYLLVFHQPSRCLNPVLIHLTQVLQLGSTRSLEVLYGPDPSPSPMCCVQKSLRQVA